MSEIANAYLTQQVEYSSPGQLTELLFRRAIRDLLSAEETWPELATNPKAIFQIVHAQSIIKELNSTLNFREGGSLAIELSRLYEYIQHVLSETVTQRKAELPQDYFAVIELLEEISGSWSEMLRHPNQAEETLGNKERVA